MLAEDLEEQFRPGGGQRHEAQFVDDEQPETGSCRCRLSSRRSSLASMSSWTSAATVVKPSDIPRWQAASPKPRATCVLPVPLPLLPMALTFSRRSTYSQRDSCMTNALFTELGFVQSSGIG